MSDDEELDYQEILKANKERANNYSPEVIKEMKMLGMEKPPEVSWGDWVGPEDLNHRHDLLIYMAASGATNKQIAEDLGFTQGRVSIILSKPEVKQKIRQLQEGSGRKDIDRRFQQILPEAVEDAYEIMKDKQEKSSLRANVAFQFMDRALGKPQQNVNVEGNLLNELLVKLDNQEKEVEELDKEEDEMDTLVESLIEEEVTVGKKDKGATDE